MPEPSAATKRRRKPQRAKQLGVTDEHYERLLKGKEAAAVRVEERP